MATISGIWRLTGVPILDIELDHTESVNFKMFNVNSGEVTHTSIKFEGTGYHFGISSNVSTIISDDEYLTYYPVIDFGEEEQTVTETFITLINRVAERVDVKPVVKGRYIVNRHGTNKARIYGTDGPPLLIPCEFSYATSDTESSAFSGLGHFYDMMYGYTEDGSWILITSSSGYNSYIPIIDFGEVEQSMPVGFFVEVLQHWLIPTDNEFLDAEAGMTMIKHINENVITTQKVVRPKMEVIKAYTAGDKSTSFSCTGSTRMTDYDMIFALVTPSTSATQLMVSCSTKLLKNGTATFLRMSSPDNTNTTYWNLQSTGITTVTGYNDSAAAVSGGYIRGIWGLKIGG